MPLAKTDPIDYLLGDAPPDYHLYLNLLTMIEFLKSMFSRSPNYVVICDELLVAFCYSKKEADAYGLTTITIEEYLES